MVISFFDITHRKDVQHLQNIIDALSEHVVILDRQGTITLANQAWRDFAERNGSQSLSHCGPGTNYLDICKIKDGADADIAQQVYYGLRKVLEGELARFTIKYPCHSPYQRRWFLMQATPIKHSSGGVLVSHINITDWVTDD